MATAIAAGSMIASGGGALAGLSTAGTFLGISAGTFKAVGLGLSIAGQLFGQQQQADFSQAAYQSSIEASRAELEAGRARFAESELGAQRERTQAALEDAERQRRLRRTLAAQRAKFAGGGVDPFTGTPAAIQQQTVGEINREARLAELATDDRVKSINRQGLGILASSKGSAASLIGQAETGLAIAQQQQQNQLGQIGQNIVGAAGLIKSKPQETLFGQPITGTGKIFGSS